MTVDFRAILSKPTTEVEKPKPFPAGVYDAVCKDYEQIESSQKKTPGIRVTFSIVSPAEDVDLEEFEAAGGIDVLAKRSPATTFYLTDDSIYRLSDFLHDHVGLERDGRSFAELLPEIKGRPVKVVFIQSINQTSGDMISLIDKVLPA